MKRLGLALLLTLSLTPGCGGGSSSDSPDAAPADAAAPDAPPPGSCGADMVDLDDPSVGTRDGNTITYTNQVKVGAGQLEPSCVSGTNNEVVHKLTLTHRSRVFLDVEGDLVPVLHVRTACSDASSEILCETQTNMVEMDDLPAETLYIVVDSHPQQNGTLPKIYSLFVLIQPVPLQGETCDPSVTNDMCATGLICSSAGGPPTCQVSTGDPTVTAVEAHVSADGARLFMDVDGADPDGDVKFAQLDFTGDGVSDQIEYGDQPLWARTTITGARLTFDPPSGAGDPVAFLAGLTSVGVMFVDSTGAVSAPVTATIEHAPTYVGPGASCGVPVYCIGEAQCVGGTCTEPSGSATECNAADTAPALVEGIQTVTIADDAPDYLQGTCYYHEGFGEAVRRLILTQPSDVIISTETMGNSLHLDSYVYLRSTCDDPTTELGCNNDTSLSLRSKLTLNNVPAGTYYVVIDGAWEHDYLKGSDVIDSGDIQVSLTIN